jgi:hypothetical protein
VSPEMRTGAARKRTEGRTPVQDPPSGVYGLAAYLMAVAMLKIGR